MTFEICKKGKVVANDKVTTTKGLNIATSNRQQPQKVYKQQVVATKVLWTINNHKGVVNNKQIPQRFYKHYKQQATIAKDLQVVVGLY